jgi:hypothetical protein
MEASQRQLANSVILLPAGRIDLSNADEFKSALLGAVVTELKRAAENKVTREYLVQGPLKRLDIQSPMQA